MPNLLPNRREILRGSVAALAGGLLINDVALAAPAAKGKPFRVVHLTDTHVQPELGAGDGLTACLRHMMTNHQPDLIIAGGDNVFDCVSQPRDRAAALFDLWSSTVKDECGNVPMISAMGNHDMWGWNKGKSHTNGDEPHWGKAWPMDVYGMPGRYYSVDRGGWHIVVLDSIQPFGDGKFVAAIDNEQFDWLKDDLAKTDANTPVLIVSHVPILSVTSFLITDSDTKPATTQPDALPVWQIPRALMHVDARKLKDLFKQHPNIKLALSGHTHMTDRIDYLGVSYLNNTAVSGNWWKGDHEEFRNGYTVLDLSPDGSFTRESVAYGWVARM